MREIYISKLEVELVGVPGIQFLVEVDGVREFILYALGPEVAPDLRYAKVARAVASGIYDEERFWGGVASASSARAAGASRQRMFN